MLKLIILILFDYRYDIIHIIIKQIIIYKTWILIIQREYSFYHSKTSYWCRQWCYHLYSSTCANYIQLCVIIIQYSCVQTDGLIDRPHLSIWYSQLCWIMSPSHSQGRCPFHSQGRCPSHSQGRCPSPRWHVAAHFDAHLSYFQQVTRGSARVNYRIAASNVERFHWTKLTLKESPGPFDGCRYHRLRLLGRRPPSAAALETWYIRPSWRVQFARPVARVRRILRKDHKRGLCATIFPDGLI